MMINMGQMILSGPSIITIWTYQDMMEWMSRMLVGEMAGADDDFGSGVKELLLVWIQTANLLGLSTMINMGQMILSEPSIFIVWTYQDMMEWMSRMLVGEMADANEDFGSGVGELWLIWIQNLFLLWLSTMINMGQMILSEPSIITIWTYQDMMEWMSMMLVGEMAGADEDFGSGSLELWLIWIQTLTLLLLSTMINMGQMIPSEPSIIIIRTYQDMMESMSRMLVGEMAGPD
jgi:hypothetical protein